MKAKMIFWWIRAVLILFSWWVGLQKVSWDEPPAPERKTTPWFWRDEFAGPLRFTKYGRYKFNVTNFKVVSQGNFWRCYKFLEVILGWSKRGFGIINIDYFPDPVDVAQVWTQWKYAVGTSSHLSGTHWKTCIQRVTGDKVTRSSDGEVSFSHTHILTLLASAWCCC